MRTVYLGTSEFAASVLERLATGPHRPALVITRPDRPSGRGRRLTPPPVADTAGELGIPLEQPERVNDPEACATIARAAAGPGSELVLVVCAFGALIKEALLAAHPILNVHPSLLPRWRGAAPIERAIMAGDGETGVSIMRLTAGLDSGPVCLAAAEAIGAQDTFGTLAPRLAARGGELLVRALDGWERGEPPAFVEQDETRATYAEKIGPADRLLDSALSARDLERRVRALHPHIGARIALTDGTMLGVLRARALPQVSASISASLPTAMPVASPPAPGVLAGVAGRLLYGTGEGALELLEVQPAGRRAMDGAAYLRGHDLPRA
ncbi:MAG TPA: methionyl-tRNA formyltransferase [Solirubrobacteraceae bacterium]|nr:methionyl-tRNA formyltransferase [Solirubrobacteraceae bacterium]